VRAGNVAKGVLNSAIRRLGIHSETRQVDPESLPGCNGNNMTCSVQAKWVPGIAVDLVSCDTVIAFRGYARLDRCASRKSGEATFDSYLAYA
jgi:hypothetical protein